MADLSIDLEISRPRREVLAWWTGFPDTYSAQDPREQPHRIEVKSRSADRIEVLTWWRAPLMKDLVIPETFLLRPNGDFDVEVHLLPFGILQVDHFTFTGDSGTTRVHIDIDVRVASRRGHLLMPLYMAWARANVPRNFKGSAKLCERDAPKLA